MEAPRRFTYPFLYTPHPLCVKAAGAVKAEVARHPEWQPNLREGKMLGVLVVEGGYLAAFSGTLCGRSALPYFVPPVFDLHDPDGHFQQEERAISLINTRLQLMPPDANELRKERKERSAALQQWLFDQFVFLNAKGERRSLCDIFAPAVPPGGAGECCAPKLLQYAYSHGLRPLCMAEFWVGDTPKGEIRQEGNFYPACQGKCKPILKWMLEGLAVDPNPLLAEYDKIVKRLRIVYDDKDIVVVVKPAGMLSVPGKDDLPSVQSEVRRLFPEATGPLIVHRLDMATSGLMVLALNEEAYHDLQDQFVRHAVEKRYTAQLERPMEAGQKGVITLPLCPNPYDRPRQVVNYEYGRRAVTRYEVTSPDTIHFYPETGRTHQLRMHAAHPDGLDNPILGDTLYGNVPSDRLHLHADLLTFTHPATGERLTFTDVQ